MRHLPFSEDEQLFNAVKNKLDNEFRETLTYDELAKTFFMNKKTLEKGFFHFFGHTIHNYKTQLQVSYACELMRSRPDMKIMEVAYDAGFNDRSTFYRAFFHFVGTTPRRWEKNSHPGNGFPD